MSDISKILLIIFIFSALLFRNASAQDIHGKFLEGQKYSAVNRFEDAVNADGIRIKRNELTVKLDKDRTVLEYKFETDSVPVVKSNPLGVISITNNSRGMEGRVRYEYISLYKNGLVSLGVVERQLQLGRTTSIEIQKGQSVPPGITAKIIENIIVNKESFALIDQSPYLFAALILLGRESENSRFKELILKIVENKEITSDKIFREALKKMRVPRGGTLRCGWLEKSMTSGVKITDNDGVWTIRTGKDGIANDDLPILDPDQWVATSSNEGYGCVCLRVVTNVSTHKVVKLISSSPKSLLACRNDKKLVEPAKP